MIATTLIGWILAVLFLLAWVLERHEVDKADPKVVNLSVGDRVRVRAGRINYEGRIYSITAPNDVPEVPKSINGRTIRIVGNLKKTDRILPSVLVYTNYDDDYVELRRAPLNQIRLVL